MKFLQGYKTYIVAGGAIIAAFVAFVEGDVNLGEAVLAALGALGISALRAGVKKAEK